MLRIEPLNPKLDKLLREWPARARHLRSQVTYLAAKEVFDGLMTRIPKDSDLRDYRNGLELAKVLGVAKDEDAYTVYVNAKRSRVRKVDGPKTLLYVRAKRSPRRTPADVGILERFNPWTTDTLPFTPNKRFAVIVSRKAAKGEVSRVAERRRREKPVWKRALTKAGVRGLGKDKGIKVSRKMKALPEMALVALSLEFGLSGKSKAHWRPVISGLRKSGLRQILRRNRELGRALTDPSFTAWSKWPKKISGRVRLGEARKFVAFQRRLGF